jgi:putative restriction endonuclease
MLLKCLVSSPNWDSPFFKILAHNDTGSAKGKQAGILVLRELRQFFPVLLVETPALNPTKGCAVKLELFVENKFLASANARYQFQTRGGKRSPEFRLTGQLGPLRNLAVELDVLVIQRSIYQVNLYRLTLVRRSSAEFSMVSTLIGPREFGSLTEALPLSQVEFDGALVKERAQEQLPFQLMDADAELDASIVRKVARSLAFRATVLDLYSQSCCICCGGLRSPLGLVAVDAAHVVPRALKGADDARNGFALCKTHHWAFDNGLFGVSTDRKILVPTAVQEVTQNKGLAVLAGHPIREAKDFNLRVHPDAFAWHRENTVIKDW